MAIGIRGAGAIIALAALMVIGVACGNGAEPAPTQAPPTVGGKTPMVVNGATEASFDTPEGPVELSLSATPVAGEPLTVRLVAELTGGPDNNRELYCPGQEWQFGDGMGMATSASCMVWTPSSTIQRRFEQTYTYEKAGTLRGHVHLRPRRSDNDNGGGPVASRYPPVRGSETSHLPRRARCLRTTSHRRGRC